MQDIYIVRFKNNRLACFYYDQDQGGAICQRFLAQGRWSAPEVLMEGALPNFTLNLSTQGNGYIFCQDAGGSIILLSRSEKEAQGAWQRRTILENQSEAVHTILFYAFIQDNAMSLIYNIPGEDNLRGCKLINQTLQDGGAWAKPQHIDTFTPMGEKLFYLQYLSPEHAVAFYRGGNFTPSQGSGFNGLREDGKDNTFGCREIAPGRWGNYHPIHQTAYPIVDTSFLTTPEGIHALYIVKGMFTSQLIYKKKEAGSFGPPVVVLESPRMDNCLLSVVRGDICAACMIGGQPYLSVSKNNGISFSKPELYKNKFCHSPVKATYLSQEPMAMDQYFCREVYVDYYNPWDVQLLPELHEDFLQAPPRMAREPMAASVSIGSGSEQNNSDLYRKIEGLQKEIADKDQQLQYMSNMLKDRGRRLEEANEAGEKLKTAYSKKLGELTAQIEKLEKENNRLLEEIKLLSLRTTKEAPASQWTPSNEPEPIVQGNDTAFVPAPEIPKIQSPPEKEN